MKIPLPFFHWFALILLAVPLTAAAAPPELLGRDGWTAVMYGTGKDPSGDSQAGAADTDIIADATHGSLYVGFSDSGTPSTADDYIYFRLRVDNPTATNNFSGVAVVGMDANGDGRIDLFMTVDARASSQVVRLMDPGTDANISPSTTSTQPLPSGWLPNNGVYPITSANYGVVGVTNTTDPHWNGNYDLGLDGKQDAFVSWRVPLSDIATVLAIPSPVDRNGNYGPRGSTGIQGFTENTLVRYVAFTQTQSGPINGDLNGVGGSYDKNATFASLGTMTEPMSASDPVSAGPRITITTPISSGYINDAEDNSASIPGASAFLNGQTLTLTVTDGTTTVTGTTTVAVGGAWTVNGLNLSGLNNGTLTVTASALDGSGNTITDTATVLHDTVPPVLGVNPLSTAGRPLISGTSTDVPAGSLVTVSIDPNGDGVLTDLVTYTAVVASDGTWLVDTSAVAPTTGTLPSAGLTAYATITASGQDAAGNTGTSAVAVDKPAVNALLSNDTTPTLTGTWGGSNGGMDTLSVTVNSVTYTTAGGNLVINGDNWTLNVPSPLTIGTYSVTATTTRGATTVDDPTSGELQIVTGPAVGIIGGATATTASTKPTITGTSTIVSGSITVRIDPNNDGNFADAIYYSVATDGSGNWSLNTQTAMALSGTYPLAGLTGTMGLLATATDSNGNQATASQALTVSIPTIQITSIVSTVLSNTTGTVTNSDFVINRREDDAITVSGTSAQAVGLTVTVTVSDGDAGTTDPTGTATVQSDGTWSVAGLDLSGLRGGYLTFTASVTGASATNTQYEHDPSVPIIRFTTPTTIDKNIGTNGTISGASDLVPGSVINLSYSGGETATAIVQANGDWFASPATGLSGSSTTITATPDVNATDHAGNRPAAAITGTFTIKASFTPNFTAVAITNWVSGAAITNGNASAVVISGTSSLANGTVVTVTLTNASGTQVVSTTATVNNGTWATTAQDLSGVTVNGPLIMAAKVTDTSVTPSVTYTDIVIPEIRLGTVGSSGAAPTITITSVGDSNLSAGEDSAVTISGTTANAPNGSTVTISVSDGVHPAVTGTAIVDGSGNWTSTSPLDLSGLNSGALTVSASVTANSQTATDNATVNHDRVAPSIAITAGPTSADATPVITGTSDLPAGSTLTVAIDADNNGTTDVTYTVTVQSGGTWSLDTGTATPTSGTFPSSGLTATSKVTVSGSDPAGNSTSISSTSITAISTDTGVSGTDFLTSDPTLVFTGKAEPGSSVDVSLNSVLVGTVTADVNGNWSLDYTGTTLAGGNYTLTALATKSTGVTAFATQSFTVDVTAPVVAVTGITTDTGASAGDFITGDNTLVFNGTAEAGSAVLVTLKDSGNNTIFATTVAATGGNWSVDYTGTMLSDGAYTLTATASDNAGNTATATQAVVVSTTGPIISITTNTKTSDTTPLITGTSDLPNSTLTVTISGATYTVATDSGGNWSVDLGTATPTSGSLTPLTNGNTYPITVSGTDAAGNSATATKSLTIDTNAPIVTVTQPIDSGGNGILDATEDNAVTIQGTLTNVPPGSTIYVTITDGTTTISDTTTAAGTLASGTWSLAALNLSGMANSLITVTATYLDDTSTPYSGTGSVQHNKSGSVTIDSITQDTGALSDFITSDNTQVFNGSASANATVTLSLSGPSGAFSGVNVTADASGAWTYDYTGTGLADGTYTLQAVNGSTATQTIVIDTTPPAGPVTVSSQTTSDTTPTITGTATLGSGENLTVTVNGVTYTVGDGNLTLVGSNWTLVIPPGDTLTPADVGGGFNGVYNVIATITDTAGNVLSDTGTGELTVQDTTTPVIDLAPGDGGTADRSVSTTGNTAVSLDNNADPATLTEASDKLVSLDLTVAGLLNGASEKLIFGSTTVAANGSSGPQSDITVGGVRVNLNHAGGVFTIQKLDYSALTAAEAQAIIRDIQYQNTGVVTTGTRTFAFTAEDEAGNTSASATASVTAVAVPDAAASTLTPTSASIAVGGSTQVLTVTAKNANGENVGGGGATVTITKLSGTGTIGAVTDNSDGTYTATVTSPTVVGSGVFVATLNGSEVKSGAATQTESTITYTAGPANKLAFVQQPTDASINVAVSPAVTVQVQDAFGNSVPGVQSITLVQTSGPGTLSGTLTQNSDANGLATFSNLSLNAAGLYSIQASSGILTAANSDSFTVYTATLTPATGGSAISADTAATGGSGAYTTLTGPVYTEQLHGQVGTGTLILNAPAGFEFDTGATVSVNVTGTGTGADVILASSTATVTSSTLSVTVNSVSTGTRTSTLTWSGIKVRPIAGTPPLASGNITKSALSTSTMVAVTDGVTNFGTLGEVPGAASKLTIATQPSSAASVNVAFAQQPVIRVEDQFGNLVTDYSGTVTATRNAGAGTLGGTTTVTVSGGLATFSNLSHDTVSTISIGFTSGALTSATSGNVTITGGVQTANSGTNYWLAIPGNFNYFTPACNLLITGARTTSGTISVPGLSFSTNFSITADGSTTIALPSTVSVNTNDGVVDLGIQVTAADEVTVHGVNLERVSADGYLAVAADALGTEYIVLAQKNGGPIAGSQLTVVASQDGTTVTITPSVATGARAAGSPYTVSLNQGQVYQLRNTDSTGNPDLSGTIITADKPVGVYGGHKAGNVPVTVNAADHLVEMLTPVTAWGKLFYAAPLANRTGYTLRLVASANNTTVSTNGVSTGVTLSRSQVYEMILNDAVMVTATAPVQVAQFAHGSAYDGATGDPFMMLVSPQEQYLTGYRFTVPSGYASYVNLVGPAALAGNVTVDGVAVNATNFTAMGGTGYSYARVSISGGAHQLSGSLPLGAGVYGWKVTESYGYPAGMNVAAVGSVSGLALGPTTANNQIGAQHCVTATVTNSSNLPVEGVRVDFSVTGNNTRSAFVFSDANGLANYCYTDNSGTIGSDTITAQIGLATQTATANWGSVGTPTISGLSSVSVTLLPAESSKAQSLTATVNDSNTGSVTVTWKVDGVVQKTGSVSSGTADTFNFAYAAGTHEVVITVDDGTGNVSTQAITVTVLDSTAPTVTLLGADPLILNLNDVFTDPGATANDVAAGDLTGSITVSGAVDTTKPGSYRLTYSVVDADGNTTSVTRMVRVVDPANPAVARADTSGTNYWLAMPGNFNYFTPTFNLLITSAYSTYGTVSVPGQGFSTNFSITAGSFTKITLPSTVSVDTNDGVVNRAISVTAADEVTVHGLNLERVSADGYLALPTDALGTEYIALGQKNGGPIPGSQLTVVASQDGTTVTITPSVTTGARNAGSSYTVSLNQGQVYQLRNTDSVGNPDLSGTIITADKPVGVYGGHRAGNVPVTANAADHLVEMLTPTTAWGKLFFTAPLATRTGYTLRLVASANNTTVTTNGTAIGADLSRGEVREMILNDAVVVAATEPIQVAQYAHGAGYDSTTGDPFMMLVSPQEQYLAGYRFTMPSGYDSYVNLISPAALAGSVTVDGVAVNATNFTAIAGSGYAYARVSVGAGAHQLSGSIPLGAGVYGWKSTEGYGYPAGMNAAPGAAVNVIALTPPPTTKANGTSHTITATVGTAGNALQFDGSSQRVEVTSSASLNFGTATDFTLEMWVKLNGSQSDYTGLLVKGTSGANWTGYQLVLYQNKLAAEIGSGANQVGVADGLVGTTSLNDGKWHHVAMVVTRSTTNAKLYVDGTQEADVTNAYIGNNLDNAANLYLGVERTPALYLNGSLDDARVWNTPRTPAQLLANMNLRLTGSESGLVALWRLNEGTGTNAADATSNGNNGTLVNSPTWVVSPVVPAVPVSGVRVDFTVSGANSRVGFDFTDASGQASVNYTDTTGSGTDTITATVGTVTSNTSVTWVP